VNQGWKDIEVLDDGHSIRVDGGVIGSRANLALQKYRRRIGPDPGSMKAALIAGIVANNASGIGSGIKYNSYNTLESMELVLTNGLILDSSIPTADSKFKENAPDIYSELIDIREKIRSSTELSSLIKHKYRLKNTSGYSLNSFLDYETPIDILTHLMVGSEGTLGFISNVELRTIPIYEHKATALVFFNTLTEAAKFVPLIGKLDGAALEIMDEYALRAIKHVKGLPDIIYTDLPPGIAALLLEFENNDQQLLQQDVDQTNALLTSADLYQGFSFSSSPPERELLWSVRRELGPLHAANRPPGTTVLSEDVCFETRDLSAAISDLQTMFKQFGYKDAIIFGHSREGNLHFKLSIDFNQHGAVENYAKFMDSLVLLVVDKYDGSLKAEHGTGRNMAPFLEKEWGEEAVLIMRKIKQLLDPQGILNPDVIISDDKSVHLKNIKAIPQVDKLIDPCIECGMCEKWCPSANLTLSPRQRIGVLREVKILKQGTANERKIARNIEKSYQYSGVDTCAADGLCEIGCPVDINTGEYMKQLRGGTHSRSASKIASLTQKHYGLVLSVLRGALFLGKPLFWLLKFPSVNKFVIQLNKWSDHKFPAISSHLSHAGSGLPTIQHLDQAQTRIVYFPSCLNRVFGDPKEQQGQKGVPETFLNVLRTAGIQAIYPLNIGDLCCGLTFSSKGLERPALQAAIQATEMLWLASEDGRIPIVMDTSPCTYHMKHYGKILQGEHLKKWQNLMILDISEFLHDYVMTRIRHSPMKGKAILHPTCSTIKMGLETKMLKVARSCSEEAEFPEDTGCCAFAGDRGLFFPELTASATKIEANSVHNCTNGSAGYYSSSRMCEVSLSKATGESYSSIVYLVSDAIKNTS
jgi:D-lactate dehydrogenase